MLEWSDAGEVAESCFLIIIWSFSSKVHSCASLSSRMQVKSRGGFLIIICSFGSKVRSCLRG